MEAGAVWDSRYMWMPLEIEGNSLMLFPPQKWAIEYVYRGDFADGGRPNCSDLVEDRTFIHVRRAKATRGILFRSGRNSICAKPEDASRLRIAACLAEADLERK